MLRFGAADRAGLFDLAVKTEATMTAAGIARLQRKIAIWSRREDALTVGTMESTMGNAGLDNRHRNHDGEISHKHGNTTVHTLRKIYGQSFAADILKPRH